MEIWVPYGNVEALLTLQAENLGELIDPRPENHMDEMVDRLSDPFKESDRIILCDVRPATINVLKGLIAKAGLMENTWVTTPFAKDVEASLPELKGRVGKFQETREKVSGAGELTSPPELLDGSKKLVLSTAVPDPLVGVVDSRVGLVLLAVDGAKKLAYLRRESDDPAPLAHTNSYDALNEIAERIPNGHFATIFPRGGEPRSLVEGATIYEARLQFQTTLASPAKAVVVSPGGKGYDETLSQAIRSVWSVIDAVRDSGEILLVSECRDGIGSEALRMLATGRISGEALRKGEYFEGAEELFYAQRLKEDYTVTLLSGLPELYTASRLRFKTAKSAGEAVNKILSTAGRNTKLHVVPRLCENLLTKAQ
jgi:hypothetical protein